jgi:O-antigen ligase
VLLVQLTAALVVAGALWLDRDDEAGILRRILLPLLLAAGLLLLGLLQLLPVPDAWSAGGSSRAAVASFLPGRATGLGASTLSAPETVDAVLRLAACLLVALATVLLVRNERHARQAVAILLVAASFQAAYGAFEYLSGRQQILGHAKRFYLDEATGTFVNRNHFAGYLALALPFALGLLMLRPGREGGTSLRDRLAALERPESRLSILALLAACTIWAGILLSYSRGGLAAALAATAALAWIARPRRALLLALPALCGALLLLQSEVRVPGERLLELDRELTSEAGRLQVWGASLPLVAARPLLGTGLGTFEGAFEAVKPAAATARWEHAHSDWIEAAVTGGLAAPLLVAGILLLALRRARSGERGGSLGSAVPACAAASLVGAALAGLFDFASHIPAHAVLLSFVAGLAFTDLASRRRALPFRGTT